MKDLQESRFNNYENMLNDHIKDDHEIKELFTIENIAMKTDLSHDEINQLSLLYYMCQRYNFVKIENMLDRFCQLRVSKTRKGRKEFIDGLKSMLQNNAPNPFGMFNK